MLQNDFYHIRVLHSFMILFLPFHTSEQSCEMGEKSWLVWAYLKVIRYSMYKITILL